MPAPPPLLYRDLVTRALREDLGHGDVTTGALVPPDLEGEAEIVAKEELVVCGLPVVREVFAQVDEEVVLSPLVSDGDRVSAGERVALLRGRVASILLGERVALNFLQRLSGVATLTRRFVEAVAGLPVRIVDTRKTTPGLRVLEKYAVAVGGGANHRADLSDGVLIKDNHLVACGSVREAVRRAREGAPHGLRVEVEVEDLEGLREALEAGADAVLLDNMAPETLAEAVRLARRLRPGVVLEASGGVCLENVRRVAATGVDLISVGRLTHSARAVDLSLRLVRVRRLP